MNRADLDNTAAKGSKRPLLHKIKQDPVCVTAWEFRELELSVLCHVNTGSVWATDFK